MRILIIKLNDDDDDDDIFFNLMNKILHYPESYLPGWWTCNYYFIFKNTLKMITAWIQAALSNSSQNGGEDHVFHDDLKWEQFENKEKR